MIQPVPVKQSSRRLTRRRVVGQRDHKAMEQRRMRAADLFERGMIPAEIARCVGVAQGLAAGWTRGIAQRRTGRAQAETERQSTGRSGERTRQRRRSQRLPDRCVDVTAGGRGDRAGHGRGLPPRPCLVHLARPVGLDLAAASAASDRTQRRGHRALGQKALAAVEKRARRQNALIMFEDESGVSLLPSVRATWAPRGQTPVLRHHFAWKRLSIAGVLAYEPDGSDAHLVFQLRPGAYNDETLIDFLSEVHQYEEQRAIILIWDGLPSHRSRRMLDWVATQRDWLSIEPLPGYAPDLNPIEQVWGNVKSQELANLCADTIGEVSEAAEDGLDRISSDAPLCFAFLRHSGLQL